MENFIAMVLTVTNLWKQDGRGMAITKLNGWCKNGLRNACDDCNNKELMQRSEEHWSG